MTQAVYAVAEVAVEARLAAGVRAVVATGQVPLVFAAYLQQVYAAGSAGQLSLDGQNIFIYRSSTAESLTVDFCVGVTAPFTAVGAVEPRTTPAGVAAHTTHMGDYAGLRHANAAIRAWCAAHGRTRAGPSWEVYGHWHADPTQNRTDVYYLLA
jgi:hypothetical protein